MNRKKNHLLWITYVLAAGIFAAPGTRALHSQTLNKDEASCRAFVQQFYDWYVKLDVQHEKSHDAGTTMDDALRLRPELFDPELLRMLKEDSAAQAKADEIVGLEFDPFFNSQGPSSKFVAQRAVIKNGRCRVSVTGIEQGTVGEHVQPELVSRDGKWVIVNFHYPNNKYPVDEDLISILKMTRADRNKAKK